MFCYPHAFLRILLSFAAALALGCGGGTPKPGDAGDAGEDVDPITAIIGDVEVDETDLEEESPSAPPGEYRGATLLTVNLRVVNAKNPEGSFKLEDVEGNTIIENGQFGVPVEVNQGVYTIEFRSPLVFGNPAYFMEDVEVSGRESSIQGAFPAGQITLHTYERKKSGPCVAVRFSVFSETLDQELEGSSKSCEPLILETGSYAVKLKLSRSRYKSVQIQVNKEQVTTAPVALFD